MPHFFKSNKIVQIISDSIKSDVRIDGFSTIKTAETLLAWIHAILDRKNEPSAEIKKMLIHAFELLKKSVVSTDSIKVLNKRLQTEETPAAKAVSEAHSKVNQLRSSIKPAPSIFTNKAASELKPSSLIAQSLFKPRPDFESERRKKDNILRFR